MSSRTIAGLWGATEAISAFVLLEQTRPLYAGVAKHNAASIRVLQKCGFKLLESDNSGADDANDTHVFLLLAASPTR